MSAWRNFKNIFSRPLFIIIFRPEMLNFHTYSILTGDTRVEFVIYRVLNMHQIFVSSILVISGTVQTDFFFSQVQKVPSRANQLPDNSWQNFGIIQKRQFVMPLKNCGGSPCATLCRKISILEFHISFSELLFRY